MMEILKYSQIDLEDTIKRSEQDVNNVLGTVSEILENVRVKKDHAIREYTEKFDGVLIENLKVSKGNRCRPDCKANQLRWMLHTRRQGSLSIIYIDDCNPGKNRWC